MRRGKRTYTTAPNLLTNLTEGQKTTVRFTCTTPPPPFTPPAPAPPSVQ